MQEMQVQSLGREDPLEEEMAIHSSIIAWKNLMDNGNWRATVHWVAELDRTKASEHIQGKDKMIIIGLSEL